MSMAPLASRAGFILTTPGPYHIKLKYDIKLEFKASNNEAEYEALIVGLKMGGSMGVKRLHIYNDS